MKQIYLALNEGIAKIINKGPVYINPNEKVEFIISNTFNIEDKLYYQVDNVAVPINDSRFLISYNDFKNGMNINIIIKEQGSLNPLIFVLENLQICQLKVLGGTIEDEYPDVVQKIGRMELDLQDARTRLFSAEIGISDLQVLKESINDLNNRVAVLESEGVIV